MSAYAPEEYEQKKLAAALAHPQKSVREKTRSTLSKYVSGNRLKDLELLRLWKALYQCLWLSDKQEVQLELAGFLSGLLNECMDDEAMLDFFAAFWRIIMKEWGSLDQFRVNKFYSLMRLMLRESFTLLSGRSWPDELSMQIVEIVETEVLYNTPNGPRYHLADIMLSELHAATEGGCSHEIVELIMSPFFHLMATSGDPVLRNRVSSAIFHKYLSMHAHELQPKVKQNKKRKAEESEGDGDKSLSVFPHASTQLLQKTLFELASSTEHNIGKNNRKSLYELHGAFQAVTGVQYVEGDGDIDSLESSGKAVSGKGTPAKKDKKKGKEEKGTAKAKKGSEKRKAENIAGSDEDKAKGGSESAEKSKKQKKKASKEDVEVNPPSSSKKSAKAKESSPGKEEGSPKFIKAKRFQGFKQGYAFKNDGKGNIGYHRDLKQSLPSPPSDDEDGEGTSPTKAERRVSFGKNRSKSHSLSVMGLKASAPPSPAVSSRTRRGVLKKK